MSSQVSSEKSTGSSARSRPRPRRPLGARALGGRRHEALAGAAGAGLRNGAAAVAPLDRGGEAELLGIALEPQALRRVAGNAIEEGGEHLRLLDPQAVDGLVDD